MYSKEKQGLIVHEVYKNISNSKYLSLKMDDKIPKAIHSMCVLLLKNNKYCKPIHAKYHIVVLGNLEDRLYQRSQRYTPVLKYRPLRLLTAKLVVDKHILTR